MGDITDVAGVEGELKGATSSEKTAREIAKHEKQRGCCDCTTEAGLSIQSGDIIRPQAQEEEVKQGKFYSLLFPVVHRIARVVFLTPVLSLILLLFVFGLAIALVAIVFIYFPPKVNFTLRSFEAPDHVSSIHWDALQAAANGNYSIVSSTSSKSTSRGFSFGADLREIDFSSCPTSATQYTMHAYWILELVYLVPEGSSDQNIFTSKRLQEIYQIEQHIYNDPNYKYFCHKYKYSSCAPVNSILSYLYVDESDPNSGLVEDISTKLAQVVTQHYSTVLWYSGGQLNNFSSSLLRSQVRVGIPLPCFDSIYKDLDEQHQYVTEFFLSFIPYLAEASTENIEVLYGGQEILDNEVHAAISHDAKLSIASILLVLLLVFILSGFSVFSTIVGILAIASCFPWAFFFYRVVMSFESVGILNVVSLFVIIGIGVDDVFVYLNTFKQSKKLGNLDTVHKRMAHTIIVAGKATFFTSITTAVAFFANAVSLIPAIKQFGVFMGLVVIFCYVQVSALMPLYLHVWHCWFMRLENLIFSPCLGKKKPNYDSLPSVRMSSIRDDDSGIDILEQGNGNTEDSESNSTGSNPDLVSINLNTEDIDFAAVGDDSDEQPLHVRESLVLERSNGRSNEPVPIDRMTTFSQVLLLKYVARPLMYLHLWQPKLDCITHQTLKRGVRWVLRRSFVWLFLLILVCSLTVAGFLHQTDRPPQFLSPDSNIQKLLDLEGNLTSVDDYNCWDCSSWYTEVHGQGTSPPPTAVPPPIPTTHPVTSDLPATQQTETQPTIQTSAETSPTTNTPSTNPTSEPPTSESTSTSTSSEPSNPSTSTPSTQPSSATTSSTSSPKPQATTNPTTKPTTAVTTSPTTSSSPTTQPTPGNSSYSLTQFSNNALVYVVFGIQGVERNYSVSHVLPEEGQENIARIDSAFAETFQCPLSAEAQGRIHGVLNALCRICKNISNPDNGLVLKDGAECFSPQLFKKASLSCIADELLSASECMTLDFTKVSNNIVLNAKFGYNQTGNYLTYLAMAFRSTTYIGGSPFTNHHDYEKWDDFLSAELDAIGLDPLYSGADEVLSTAYQTSEYWVEMNVIVIAVYGSVYGIILSFVLCSIVVVFLSHDWRIVLSMLFTIIGILATLLGLFKIFGWTLGVVEAVSLSILVGNSLDYCIHLTEGYLSTDARHLAFLEKFKFAAGASIRVKHVMVAISFIGVSIISSAVTTILATMPLLGTSVQLFTRFGEILILDTLVAILFTLVFCSTFLSFIGPKESKWSFKALLNALGTIGFTLLGYGILVLILYISATLGVDIPSPVGTSLFQ